MRRTSRRGWLLSRNKRRIWNPRSTRRTKNQIKARQFYPANAGPAAGPGAKPRFQATICGVLACTAGLHAAEFEFHIEFCIRGWCVEVVFFKPQNKSGGGWNGHRRPSCDVGARRRSALRSLD